MSLRAFFGTVMLLGGSAMSETFTTIVPTCAGLPNVTITQQHQTIPACGPWGSPTTSVWVSTVIPCWGGPDTTSSCTVTITDQPVPCSATATTFTSTSSTKATPSASSGWGAWTNATYDAITWLDVHSKEFVVPYNELGPLAIPGYDGCDLCEDCDVLADGTQQQVVAVWDCTGLSGQPACTKYSETWISLPVPSTTGIASAEIASQTSCPYAGEFTFTFPQSAPTTIVTSAGYEFTAPGQAWDAIYTTSITQPGIINLNIIVTQIITFNVPYSTSRESIDGDGDLGNGFVWAGWAPPTSRPAPNADGASGVDHNVWPPASARPGWSNWMSISSVSSTTTMSTIVGSSTRNNSSSTSMSGSSGSTSGTSEISSTGGTGSTSRTSSSTGTSSRDRTSTTSETSTSGRTSSTGETSTTSTSGSMTGSTSTTLSTSTLTTSNSGATTTMTSTTNTASTSSAVTTPVGPTPSSFSLDVSSTNTCSGTLLSFSGGDIAELGGADPATFYIDNEGYLRSGIYYIQDVPNLFANVAYFARGTAKPVAPSWYIQGGLLGYTGASGYCTVDTYFLVYFGSMPPGCVEAHATDSTDCGSIITSSTTSGATTSPSTGSSTFITSTTSTSVSSTISTITSTVSGTSSTITSTPSTLTSTGSSTSDQGSTGITSPTTSTATSTESSTVTTTASSTSENSSSSTLITSESSTSARITTESSTSATSSESSTSETSTSETSTSETSTSASSTSETTSSVSSSSETSSSATSTSETSTSATTTSESSTSETSTSATTTSETSTSETSTSATTTPQTTTEISSTASSTSETSTSESSTAVTTTSETSSSTTTETTISSSSTSETSTASTTTATTTASATASTTATTARTTATTKTTTASTKTTKTTKTSTPTPSSFYLEAIYGTTTRHRHRRQSCSNGGFIGLNTFFQSDIGAPAVRWHFDADGYLRHNNFYAFTESSAVGDAFALALVPFRPGSKDWYAEGGYLKYRGAKGYCDFTPLRLALWYFYVRPLDCREIQIRIRDNTNCTP